MSLKISCPQCAKQYKVSDSYVGKKVMCKACGSVISVPETNETFGPLDNLLNEIPAETDVSGRPLAPLSAIRPKPVKTKSTSSAPRPAGKQKATDGGWLSDKYLRGGLILIVAGVVVLFIARRECRLAELSDATPQKMTLAALAAHGPGDNIHIELSEIRLLPDLSVIKYEGANIENSSWSYVWIPAVPLDQHGQPDVSRIKVIIGTKECSNEARLNQFCRGTTLQGLVVNETDSLGSEERKLLNEGLEGFDAATCYFFRAGQKPASATTQNLLLAGGGLALVAGLGIGALRLRAGFSG